MRVVCSQTTRRGYDLLAPAFALAQHGSVSVGGFHDCVIRPMLAAHIREGVELAEIVRDVVLIRFAAQQSVDNGDDLRAVDLVVSAEGAVAIAVDPAMLGGSLDVRGGPIVLHRDII